MIDDLTFEFVVWFWWNTLVLFFLVAAAIVIVALTGTIIMDIFHWFKMLFAKRRLKMLTWTCHICGEERPDEYISVMSKSLNIPGVDAHENIRYCNDKPSCIEGAKAFSFVQGSAKSDE